MLKIPKSHVWDTTYDPDCETVGRCQRVLVRLVQTPRR